MNQRFFRKSGYLVVALLLMAVPTTQTWAAMVSTERVVSSMAAERARIQALVEREEIQAKLVELGVSPKEASDRIASLSDAEIASVAGQIDQLPVGGDGVYIGLGTLLVILIIVLLLR